MSTGDRELATIRLADDGWSDDIDSAGLRGDFRPICDKETWHISPAKVKPPPFGSQRDFSDTILLIVGFLVPDTSFRGDARKSLNSNRSKL